MNGIAGKNKSRSLEISDRASAENLLGFEYKPRIYTASHGTGQNKTAKGIVTVCDNGIKTALGAYIINGGRYAHGLILNRNDRIFSLILAPKKYRYTQSELAEAVDFWENGRANQIYCLFEKSCGAVIFTEENGKRLYLMICMSAGHCGLPKGHVEKFETEREAALREIYEETGVSATLFDGFRETVEYPISIKSRKETVYFVGFFNGDRVKIQESEICGYKLCPYEEARGYITHENDRKVLDKAEIWLGENYNV